MSDSEIFRELLRAKDLDFSYLDELETKSGEAPVSQPAPDRSFLGWTEEPSLYLSESEYERFVLRSKVGAVRFDGRVTQDYGILDWDADIPSELKPGQSIDDFYDKFLPLITTWLPNKMMLGLDTLEQTKLRYRKGSQILLETGPGVKEIHKLETEKDTAKLALRLTQGEERIARMRIVAGLGLSDYTLDLSYGRGMGRGRMELRLPLNSRGADAYTGSTAEWVLSTHMNKSDLGADLSVPSARLAEIMKGKMSGGLARKEKRGQG